MPYDTWRPARRPNRGTICALKVQEARPYRGGIVGQAWPFRVVADSFRRIRPLTPAARCSAAIEVLTDIAERRRPAADALKDWGLAHRFAGSGDRAGIASLVYDALRRRASAAWIMGAETPRAILIGTLRLQQGLAAASVAALFTGERFAPAPLSDDERARLDGGTLHDAPPEVAGDAPAFVLPDLAATLGDDLVPELKALARRAPRYPGERPARRPRRGVAGAGGLRCRADTPRAGGSAHSDRCRWARSGAARGGGVPGRLVRDPGRRIAARRTPGRPRAGEIIVDLCAGGGGKTLALAAETRNEARLIATDGDPRRLAPIHERLRRSGAVAEVRTPRSGKARADMLEDLDGKVDRVVVDAPCTGSGTWRRNPDAKWRLRPGSLALRTAEQAQVLDRAARLVRPGGRIVYITCSLLSAENDAAVSGLLSRWRGRFDVVPAEEVLAAGPDSLRAAVRRTAHGIQMSPLRTGTDGFYVAIIARKA